jgi:hypothetical protein
VARPWHGRSGFLTGVCNCFYYFFIVVIRYETKTAARRALTFIVRIFVNDTIAITVWTSFYFHACSCSHWYGLTELSRGSHEPDCLFIDIGCLHAGYHAEQVMVDVRYWQKADIQPAESERPLSEAKQTWNDFETLVRF